MRILLLLIPFLMIGCKSDVIRSNEEQAQIDGPTTFFSLTKLVQQEAKKMNQQHCSAYKIVLIKDTKESKQQTKIDWNKELRPISMADINKTAWETSFKVDTILNTTGYTVKYSTASAKIPIKLLVVQFDSLQNPTKIIVERTSKNLFFESSQHIEYQPGIGFKADGNQKVIGLNNEHFNIESKFTCKP
jgi:hypothetical protein